MAQATPLETVLARRLRELRDERDLRQDDVAAAAQDHGLAWSQSTVASVETGRRSLTATELLLLPSILGCRLEDLLCAGRERVEIRPGVVAKCPDLRLLLTADFREAEVIELQMPRGRKREVQLGPVTEDVRRVARAFEATHLQVRAAAFNKFRRPLRDERDDRVRRLVEERGEKRPTAPRLRALRGRVMRDLMAELEPQLNIPMPPLEEPTEAELAHTLKVLEEAMREDPDE